MAGLEPPQHRAQKTREATLLELDAQILKRPVQEYIEHKLSALKGKAGYDDDTLAAVSNVIRKRASNTFLWVALVFKRLDSVGGWYAAEIIDKIPSGLSELYDHMMTRIEKGDMRDPELCKNVLAAASLAYRPLSLAELAIVAGLPPNIPPQDLVEKCGSFLTIIKRTVYPIHQSARDYLMSNYESRLQPAGVARGHVDISLRCIDAMSSRLKQYIYSRDYGFRPKDTRPPEQGPLASIRYACVFWADHLCFPDSRCPELQGELVDNNRMHRF